MNKDSFDSFSEFGPAVPGERGGSADTSLHGLLGEDNLQVGGRSLVEESRIESRVESLSSPLSFPENSEPIGPILPSQTASASAVLVNDGAPEVSQLPSVGLWSGHTEVNKMTWAQIGKVAEPGRYKQPYGWVSITAADLAVWRRFPDASFALCEIANPQSIEGEFRLGSFDPHPKDR